MNAPDKIYIFQDGDELWYKPEEWETPPSNRVEYIRKDSLLELAKKNNKRIDTEEGDYSLGYVSAMIDLIEKIESL